MENKIVDFQIVLYLFIEKEMSRRGNFVTEGKFSLKNNLSNTFAYMLICISWLLLHFLGN